MKPPLDDQRLHVTVLIPAHNEEATIATAITGLQHGTRPPDRIIVVADNCTDATEEIASAAGVSVWPTRGNTDKKAGGLNQALARLLPEADETNVYLVTDADTELTPRFVEVAAQNLEDDPGLSAVGGLFFGESGGGLIGQLQRNEYQRYQRETLLKGGQVMVLSGTASMFRAGALEAVAEARGDSIPGRRGQVYDTLALTEDNELTIALKSLGFEMRSPDECRNVTEVMPTWGDLWRQRERWMRGALENLRNYGWTPTTRKYWRQQIGLVYGVIALTAFFVLMVLSLLAVQAWVWAPFWIAITGLFFVERLATVWRSGWAARIVAAPLFVELVYSVFLQLVFIKAATDALMKRGADWNYVPREAT